MAMPSSVALSNAIVMKKYVWMCRQLRSFNDVGSIMNWVNATISVKSLLFIPPPSGLFHPDPHPSSHLPNQQLFSANIWQSPNPGYSIARPTTLSFNPTKKKPLTRSPGRCSSYVPCKPSPLTTYTLRLPNICPTDTHTQCPKRRKLDIPPSVDYNASTTPTLNTSTTPIQTKAIDENTIKNTLWDILDSFQNQGRLFVGNDRRVPIWAQEEAEKRLQLPEKTLNPWMEIIRNTTARYYNHHGRRPPKWDVK